MFYAVHDKDGSLTGREGQITQAIKIFVGDDERRAYEQRLIEDGHAFVTTEAVGVLPPEKWFVSGGSGGDGITKRPLMTCLVVSTTVKAGSEAVIVGIPKGAAVDVLCSDMNIWSLAALDGDELQFNMPNYPCTFKVVVRKWPFQDWTIDIQGVA